MNVKICVDEDVVREAKELGLNISKVCENALREAIERLRPLYGKRKQEDCEKMGPAGFEPATTSAPGWHPEPS